MAKGDIRGLCAAAFRRCKEDAAVGASRSSQLARVSSNFPPLSPHRLAPFFFFLPALVRSSAFSPPRQQSAHPTALCSHFTRHKQGAEPAELVETRRHREVRERLSPFSRIADGQLRLQWRPPPTSAPAPSPSTVLRCVGGRPVVIRHCISQRYFSVRGLVYF